MHECVSEMHNTLYSEALKESPYELEPDGYYTDGACIYRLLYEEGDRWYYYLFKIDEENISSSFEGNCLKDGFKESVRPIKDMTIDRIKKRFQVLQETINQLLENSR